MSIKHKIPEKTKPLKTHLVHFTEREEMQIAYAIDSAKEYFKKYGRGRQPFMIDKSKYYN